MSSLQWLEQWAQPVHTQSAALERYRESYQTHPARLLVLRNFLQDDCAAALSQFLTEEAAYQVDHALYGSSEDGRGRNARHVTQEEWLATDEARRMYRFQMGQLPPGRLTPSIARVLQLRTRLMDPRFVEFFHQATGVALGPVNALQIHAMGAGDFIRPHDDRLGNRRMAYILYLTPGWRPEYGGTLHIVHTDGQVTDVQPEYNSLIFFDVKAHRHHYVDPITPAAGALRRLTIGGWVDEA